MQKFGLNVFLIAVGLCSISGIAFSCGSLRYIDNTPIVFLPPSTPNYTLSFNFTHDNPGGIYTCFVRDLERCPIMRQEQSCEQMQTVTFTGLQPGVWFSCGVRCRFGGIQRQITRSFPTPAVPTDCEPLLVNDGFEFVSYTPDGDANTCFEWSSSGNPMGFECRIDSGIPFSCSSPHCEVLSPTQHTVQITPLGCVGDVKILLRRVEVPAEGCATPFSIN